MKIRIVNKKLRKFQQDGLYTPDDGFGNPEPPKFQVNPILSPPTCPPGQLFNDILQKCVTPEEESQFKRSMQGFSDWRTGKVPNQMKSTGNEGTDANPMGRGPVETSNPLESSLSSKSYDPTLASILTAGLFGLGDILQKNNLQQASRRFQIRSGMTDSYFPVVPNLTSRGTTEINTGEMFPNLRVPVQFPGNPYASINRQPYFGMAQEGALIPKVPYDVPEINIPVIPSFNYTMGTDVYSNKEETSSMNPLAESSSVNIVNSDTNAEISFTHNNPLNIHYGDFARKYGGTKGHPDSDGNVAIFQNIDTGITAARDLLFGPTYRNLTISQARKRWVGGPSNSVSNIVKAMGGDKLLSSMTVEEREKLIKEFARWEGKQAYNLLKNMDLKPYLKDEYREGGEYDLTDDEIDYILANGGEIEYL